MHDACIHDKNVSPTLSVITAFYTRPSVKLVLGIGSYREPRYRYRKETNGIETTLHVVVIFYSAPPQASPNSPTLAVCPSSTDSFFPAAASQICT